MLSMNTEQECPVVAAPVDVAKQPVTLAGDPTWTSSNPAVATVTGIPGTLTANVIAVSQGTTIISCSGTDAQGNSATSKQPLSCTITAPGLDDIGITAGTPVLQPAAGSPSSPSKTKR